MSVHDSNWRVVDTLVPEQCPGDEAPARPAPALGVDTNAILGGLGYDETRIETLRAQKVI